MTEKNADEPTPVQLPSKAVSAKGDLLEPLKDLLGGLNLLPSNDDLKKAGSLGSVFQGPPDSVALIEAGGTALSKGWANGLGGAVLVLWGGIAKWWDSLKVDSVRGIVLWGASIATAAAILALGYIIGSDLRGRSAAMVATIQARAKLADTMVRTSGDLFSPTPASATLQLIALPGALRVQNIREKEDDEKGWKAVALQSNGEESTKYLITKGQRHKWVDAEDVVLD